MTDLIQPPRAEQRPHRYDAHGETIEDPWHWLRDPGYPQVHDEQVLAYLQAENDYFQQAMQPHQGLIDTLFGEMKGRLKEDESSVPIRDGEWLYWWAFSPGAQYRSWYRKKFAGGPDELLFDEPAEAEGKEYFRLGAIEASPDGRLLAVLVDDNGSERFKLRIRDIASGKDIETVTDVAIGQPVWSSDSQGIVFNEVNENWRSYRARFHRLGRPADEDVTLYEETEELGFSVHLSRSQDRELIFIATGDNATTEVRFVPAADPTAAPVLISPRKEKCEYSVDSAHGKLWIVTNDEHVNFRLAEADPAAPNEWTTVIAGSAQVYLRGATSFRDHLAITQRVEGLDQLVLRKYSGEETRIPFGEASYSAGFGGNPEFAPDAYRLIYSSMVTPQTVYDYHPHSGELETLKVQEIPSGYDPSLYRTERLMVAARDGQRVPVSVVYPRDFSKDGTGKLLLYAYGAYGYAVPPSFSTSRISLLDRGWAFAIAHIRGGDDLGHDWFLQGKLDKRTNTFNDFVDSAKGLIAAGFTSPGNIAIQGGSAGGELMGAVANSDPALWGAVVADVPFVDVLNTMLDDTLPLTPGEWPEWGNPITDKAAFELIRSYSPYDNVKAQDYPPMLITGGLNDPRVTYWEPAKWAARLRATKTDGNVLLLKINMGAGHGGKSGRWDHLKEIAEAYAFMLTQVGGEEEGEKEPSPNPLPQAGEGS
ncbi:S9 family peptidase [Sphingomonas sp.]|uniref:S9 family peptidase n=1 Tax=Sphingomonas sp. TaxID=28214 RepID=UPI00185534C1|nr:S9 family peptidase [Sphingomonas sp.]MBA3511939.1 S9 family peptidase [Sphingomonas sp.]